MAWLNKVIWTEGMFLQPHHFQQQDRHFEYWVESRCGGLRNYSWGVTSLAIDEELLALGKFAVTTCHGIFPDGTPFKLPINDSAPVAIDVPEDCKNENVYLALPIRRQDGKDVTAAETQDDLSRYRLGELAIKDSHSEISSNDAVVQSGDLWIRVRLERQELGSFTTIPIARILERKSDGQVLLDQTFIPTCLHAQCSQNLADYIEAIQGLLHHRGEALAHRIGSPGAGGIGEIADFLLLQIVNRYETVYRHFTSLANLHPEALYRCMLQLAGETATITRPDRRPPDYPVYQHDNLTIVFEPLFLAIQEALNWVAEKRTLAIPLEKQKHQVYTAAIGDLTLLQSANFVLAVNAEIGSQTLQTYLPRQITIATTDKLRDLVMNHIRGIEIHTLSAAPRQIPFRTGFSYFSLEKNHQLWADLEKTGTIAIHFAGEYPGLELEFWAVRG